MRYRDFRKNKGKPPSEEEAGTRAARGGRGSEPPPEIRKDRGPRLEKVEGEALIAAAQAALEAAAFDVVQARAFGDGRLRFMIDGPDGLPVTVDDCTRAARVVADAVNAAGKDAGAFDLEVESPGADRPLTRPKDFARFMGQNITITLMQDREGRRNFTGALLARDAATGALTIKVFDETEPTTFQTADIREVRLHEVVKVPPRERK